MAYDSKYDYTLKQLQAQLTAQLEQEQAEIASQQEFSEFMRDQQTSLLAEQAGGRQRAAEAFQQVLAPAFQGTLGRLGRLTAQQAQDVEAQLAGDTARQTAVGTIRRAAGGEDITGTAQNLAAAAGARGQSVSGLENVEAELATLGREAAAPVAYQLELDRILRPFQTQARSAEIARTVAGTQAAGVQAQAQALGGLSQLQAGPVDVLANLYGQSAGAFRPVAGGEDVIAAQFGDYGYEVPFGLGAFV